MKQNVCLASCLAALLCTTLQADELRSLREGFRSPPPEAKAQTWWHWTTRFVTQKGITADLEAMKAIGYSGAHLFVTGGAAPGDEYPKTLTPEWLDLIGYTGKEAQRLGLELGIHNCPGWSSSGGPWIRPEESMQMVVSSETNVRAGESSIRLPQPETRHGFYRDIAVVAFPDVNDHTPPRITADYDEQALNRLCDEDKNTFINLPISKEGTHATLTFGYDSPRTVQFAELSFGELHLFIKGTIETSLDGTHYRQAAAFDYKIRTDMKLPKCIRLQNDAQQARFVRITFRYRPYRYWMKPANVELREVRLLTSSMVSDVDSRNSAMEDNYSYKPFEKSYTTPGIDPKQVREITHCLRADGTLEWTVPEGNWTILRIGHTSTGKMNGPSDHTGLECDKLDRRGLDAHWPHMVGKVKESMRESGALKYITIDSYEAGGQNWTPAFPAEFSRRRGYEITSYLPAIAGFVVGTPQQSARFLYDYQHTISELFAENYYDYFTTLCHQNGFKAITESYFGPFDYLRCARHSDLPTGEFWVGYGTEISRMPGSSGHVQGHNHVGAEAFTTGPKDGRWQQDPLQLKSYGDRAWIQGVSQLIMHSYVHQPLLNVRPGMTLGVHGSHLSRTNTWWPYGNGWVEYLNRSQFLLQSGRAVADLLILSGESAPNNYPREKELLEGGYNYDFCCIDDLYERIRVEDGRITAPSGTDYALLSLGPDRYLSLKTLHRIDQLLQAGATLAARRPLGTPSLSDDETQYRRMVTRIWGEESDSTAQRKIGKGTLYPSIEYRSILQSIELQPDVQLVERISAIHRRTDSAEIYFLHNDSMRMISFDGRFRIPEGYTPECWYADGARMEPFPVWDRDKESVRIPLTMMPYESFFVVFRRGDHSHLTQATAHAITPSDTLANPAITLTDPSSGTPPDSYVFFTIEPQRSAENTAAQQSPQRIQTIRAENVNEASPAVCARIVNEQPRLLFSRPAIAHYSTSEGKTRKIAVRSTRQPLSLNKNWAVHFAPHCGAPDSIHLEELISLSEHADQGVRYFSGTAHYAHRFALSKEALRGVPAKRRILLDLGFVRNIAEVRINGHKVALLWKQPFSSDVTDYLHAGENCIEIAVTTLWVNRLIGDARTPQKHPTAAIWPDWVLADRSNDGEGHYTYSAWRQPFVATEPLQPSGLIGPVQLRFVEVR